MVNRLPFIDQLFAKASTLHQLGVHHEAVRRLRRLTNLGDLPAEVAEQAQSRLADLCLQRGLYAKARRHLGAALSYQPDNPRYHFLLAQALAEGAKADPERALEHYRRALELDPKNPEYLAAVGQYSIRHGNEEEGCSALRRAYELAMDDVNIVEQVVDGLWEAGADEEAMQKLRLSLFRNHRQASFRRLWDHFHFQNLHEQQQNSASAYVDGPVLLPFFQEAAGQSAGVRRDGTTGLAAPHFPRSRQFADRKQPR